MRMADDDRRLTDEVVRSFAGTTDPRLRALLVGLTEHLHAFVRDVCPTLAEWEAAIRFLTAVGQASTETRQEMILLSDVLGISSLVTALNDQPGGTEGTVLGPFHVVASPERGLGDNIDLLGRPHPAQVRGRVVDPDGRPVPGAVVDVWQCSDDGFYDVQQPDRQPLGNGRGLFHAEADGRFWFRTVVPSHYRRPRGRSAECDRSAPVPAGAHPPHRLGARLRNPDDARVRGRQPVPGLGCGVRGARGLVAAFAPAPDEAPDPAESPDPATPVRVADVELVLVPAESG
jgi:protocatechuate 3,4-dioxygenase beta subunit